MEALRSRSRTNSESSDMGLGGMCEVGEMRQGTSYDMDESSPTVRLSSVVWFSNSRLLLMKMENLIIILLTCDQFLQDGMIWIKASIVFLLDGIKWTRSRRSKIFNQRI